APRPGAVTHGGHLLAPSNPNGLRPARWAITPNVVLVASEAGVCPEEEAQAERTGQLGPGDMLLFERRTGQISFGDELRSRMASRAPYEDWISNETLYVQHPFEDRKSTRLNSSHVK